VIDILRYHKITDRDRESPLLEILNDGKQDTGAAATETIVQHGVIEQDKLLFVQNWSILAITDPIVPCDATQTAFGASFVLGGTTYFTQLNAAWNHYGGLSQYYFSADQPIILYAGEKPEVRVYFTVAGNHTVNSRIRGWLIPKGNLARGFGGL